MRPSRMTTRRWMIAIAVAALLSAGLATLVRHSNRRSRYLAWVVGRFAAVKTRTGVILESAEAQRSYDLLPPQRR